MRILSDVMLKYKQERVRYANEQPVIEVKLGEIDII